MLHPNTIQALITLLDDPDEGIYEEIYNRFLEIGPACVSTLEKSWEDCQDNLMRERIEMIIHDIQFNHTKSELLVWQINNHKHLLDGLLILEKWLYPNADLTDVQEGLEKIKRDIWLEFGDESTPLEQVTLFNIVFYKHYEFKAIAEGNTHSPDQTLISGVFKNKQGNSMGLGLLYLVIAQRLRMPIFGVCLKRYFVLCMIDTYVFNADLGMINSKDILFYINPYNSGKIFKRTAIIDYLQRMKLHAQDKYFNPAFNIEIIKETLEQLRTDFELSNNKEKAEEADELLRLLRMDRIQ